VRPTCNPSLRLNGTSIAASDEDESLWPAASASAYPPAHSARALHELEAMTMEAQLAHVLASPS
jgi:hypothetical protein